MQSTLSVGTDLQCQASQQSQEQHQGSQEKPAKSLSRLSLRSRIAWSVVANTSRALTQVGYLVAFANLGSLEMAGQYALGLAISAPIFMFLNMGLRQLQGTDTNEEYFFGDYLGLRILTSLLGVLVVGAVVVAMGYPHLTSLIILVVAGSRTIESISDTFHGLFQQQERNDFIALSQGTKSLASLAALALVLWYTGNAITALLVAACIRFLLLLLCDLQWSRLRESVIPRYHAKTLKRLASVAVPLGLVAMFVSLSANIPRYYLAHYQGERALGIYAMLELVLQLVLMVTISIQQATSARLANSYAEGANKFRRQLFLLLAVGVAWGVIATTTVYFFGSWMLAFFLGNELVAYHGALTLLVAAAIAFNTRCFLGAALVVMRRTRLQAIVTAASTIVTLLLGWFLVPKFGITGAACTLLLSGVAFVVFATAAMQFWSPLKIHMASK